MWIERRSYIRACVAIGSCLLLVSTSQAQKRTVTEAEIDALVTSATAARKSLACRVKRSTLTVFDSPSSQPEVQAMSTTEYLPPDRSYTIVERWGSTGSLGRSEIIQIGDKRFTKQPAGEWKLVTAQATGDGWGSGSGVGSATGTKTDPPKINLECEYVGTSEIKGVLVDEYKKIRTITFSTPNGRRTRIVAKKYWFDKKGLLVREISDDDFAGATKSYRTVVEYEYDPTIKIEAPIN